MWQGGEGGEERGWGGGEEEEEDVGRTEERSTLFLFFGDQGMIHPPRRGER